jgi:hypothetical protein
MVEACTSAMPATTSDALRLPRRRQYRRKTTFAEPPTFHTPAYKICTSPTLIQPMTRKLSTSRSKNEPDLLRARIAASTCICVSIAETTRQPCTYIEKRCQAPRGSSVHFLLPSFLSVPTSVSVPSIECVSLDPTDILELLVVDRKVIRSRRHRKP